MKPYLCSRNVPEREGIIVFNILKKVLVDKMYGEDIDKRVVRTLKWPNTQQDLWKNLKELWYTSFCWGNNMAESYWSKFWFLR